MRRLARLFCVLLAFGLIAEFAAAPSPALAQNRNNNRNNRNNRNRGPSTKGFQNQLKSQAARARAQKEAALRRAAAAQYKDTGARQQVETFLSHVRSMENSLDGSVESLRELQRQIESTQEEGSKLHVALADLEAAEKKYQEEKHRVFNSEDYKAAYRRALASSDKATLLPQLRREAMMDPEYRKAEDHLDFAQKQAEQARYALYEEDPQWNAAIAANRSAREQLAKAKQAFENALMRKASASSALRESMALASDAEAFIKAAEAGVKQLQAAEKRRQQQRSRNNRRNSSRSRR